MIILTWMLCIQRYVFSSFYWPKTLCGKKSNVKNGDIRTKHIYTMSPFIFKKNVEYYVDGFCYSWSAPKFMLILLSLIKRKMDEAYYRLEFKIHVAYIYFIGRNITTFEDYLMQRITLKFQNIEVSKILFLTWNLLKIKEYISIDKLYFMQIMI